MKEDNSNAFSPSGMTGSSGSNHISFNVPWTPEHSGNLFSPNRSPPSEHFLTPMLGLMDTLPLSNDHVSIVDMSMHKRIPTSKDWSPAINQMRNAAASADFVFADASPPRLPHKKRYELIEDIHSLMASPDALLIRNNNSLLAKRYKKIGGGYDTMNGGLSAAHSSSNHPDSQNYYDHLEDDSFFSNVSLFNNRNGSNMGIAEGHDLLGDEISYGDMTLEGSLHLLNTSSNKRNKSSSNKSGAAKSTNIRKKGGGTAATAEGGPISLLNENSNDGSQNSSSNKKLKSQKMTKGVSNSLANVNHNLGSPSDSSAAGGNALPASMHISPPANANGTYGKPPTISPAFPNYVSGTAGGGGIGSESKQVVCNCKKSRCLKLYCDCFKQSIYCNGCNCNDCANNFKFESDRSQAVQAILDRNPAAFQPRVTKHEESATGEGGVVKIGHLSGCHCKKSNCLKKYCECFSGSAPCSERCRCVECKNAPSTAVAEPNLALIDPI